MVSFYYFVVRLMLELGLMALSSDGQSLKRMEHPIIPRGSTVDEVAKLTTAPSGDAFEGGRAESLPASAMALLPVLMFIPVLIYVWTQKLKRRTAKRQAEKNQPFNSDGVDQTRSVSYFYLDPSVPVCIQIARGKWC